MAGKSRLPGTDGWSLRSQDRVRRLVGVLGLIFVGAVIAVVGVPGGARTIGGSPSPHPAPSSHWPSARTTPSKPLIPAPAPQAPPARTSADAYAGAVHDVGAARGASVDERVGSPADERMQLPVAAAPDIAVKQARARLVAHSVRTTKAHAGRAISPDRLNRSLIYSSALALAIAVIGLTMLGSRRRLW